MKNFNEMNEKELGVKVGVSSRNISSVICYLRDDGIEIRKMNRGGDIGLVLWSKIVGGKKVGNRVELDKGGVVRFNFKEGKFEDEIVKEEVKKEVVKKEVVKKEVVKKEEVKKEVKK